MPLVKNLELYYQHRPVADLTALAAVVTTGIVDGLVIEVSGNGFFKFELPAVATPDGRDVVVGASGGNWIRQTLGALTTAATGTEIAIESGGTGQATQQAALDALVGGTATASYVLRSDGANSTMSAIQGSDVTGTVGIANGGTGATTAQLAINALAGSVTDTYYLRADGTDIKVAAIAAGDVPTLNQNTTGTSSNVTGTVAIANGGTGATTAQAGIDALVGGVAAATYVLRSDGANVSMAAIAAGDLPVSIDAAKIADGSVSSTEFQYLDGVTSDLQPQLNGKETVFNGVEDATLFAVTYDASTREFTVTYTAGAAYTVGGVRYAPAPGAVVTTPHAATAGNYYLYYEDTAGTLTVSASEWDIDTDAPLVSAYYNPSNAGGAADGYLQYEIHPGDSGMSGAAHKYLHNAFGTQLLSGCLATGYTLNSAVDHEINWATDQGQILDEDIQRTVTAQALGGANTYRVLYLTGTTGSPVWNWVDTATDGIYSNGTDIYWNENNAGTWQLTPKTVNNKFVNYYILTTTAYNAPQVIVVMGQLNHANIAAATAATFEDDVTNFSLFTNEAVIVYKVTYERQSTTVPANARIRAFTRVVQSLVVAGVGGTNQASNITVNTSAFDGLLSAADTNVQLALQTIDDSFPLAISNGGTGATTQQAALDALVGGVATVTHVLRSDGANSSMAALQSGDIPTLNQDTTGKAADIAGGDANYIPYQDATDSTAFISSAASSVLVTSAGSVPSLSNTLPAVNSGATLVTDPTTTSSAALDTALSNIYSAAEALTSYDVSLSSNLTLTNTTDWQDVTGITLTLPAGTYLLNQSITLEIYLTSAIAGMLYCYSRLHDSLTSVAVPGTDNLPFRWYMGTTTNGSDCGGTTTVLTLASTATIKLQVSTNITTNFSTFKALYASFTALKIA